MKIMRIIVMFLLVPALYVIYTASSLGKLKKYRGEMQPGGWYKLFPEGLRDARGKASPFFARKGTANKLMVYFCGGGVSWSERSAARPMSIPAMMLGVTTYYTPKVYPFMAALMTGILSRKPENPFHDWNMIFIPYVTGDFHLGNNEFKYGGGRKTLYHIGEMNTRIIMDECKKLFPETEILLICGESAGAFAAAGNAPLVAGYYPDAPAIVYSDASQLVVPLWRATAGDVWGVNEKLLEKIEENGDLYYDLVEYSSAGLGERAVFLRSNTFYDEVLIQFGSTLRGGPHEATPEAVSLYFNGLAATEKRLAASGLPYYAFLTSYNRNPKTGLTQHTMCHSGKAFYCSEDTGVSLCEWLSDAVAGRYRTLGRDELFQT